MKQWDLDNWVLLITVAVALYGAVLSTVAYRRAGRAELAKHTERAQIMQVFAGKVSTPYADLRVEIVNTGQCDVPIRDVKMHRQGDESPMTFLWERGKRPLPPRERAIYERPLQDLGKFTGATPDQVWIVVRSNLRELDRVNGAGALPLLEEHFSAKH